MKEYFSLKQIEKEEVIKKIRQILFEKEVVVFTFIFGSFLDSLSFRDIDIGVYVNKITESQVFDFELKLSKEISDKCRMPFDIFEVKILNFAPSSFLNNIFSRGKLLFSKNQQLLTDMIENTSLDAIANEYIAYQSLKELMPA